MERYYNEKNEMGVLISAGYGAGWSTWNEDNSIAFDKRIIEKWLRDKPTSLAMWRFLKSLGYEDVYMGGYDGLVLKFVPKGTMFYITEYDGCEGICVVEELGMIMA